MQESGAAVVGDDGELSTARARTLLDEGKVNEAQAMLGRILNASPNSVPANVLLGQTLLTQGRFPEAMDRFETVLTMKRQDAEARAGELTAATQLALKARGEGKQDAALLCLDHAREFLPDDPTLLTDLGIQALGMHRLPAASNALEAALVLEPGDAKALYALARVETEQQHFPAAETHLRSYLSTHPEDASAYFGLGHLFYMQQRLDDARAAFERSIALQPVQTESYYQLGQMDLDVHSDAEATAYFEKVLGRDGHHGGALTGMGILAYRAKDFAAARGRLAAAAASSPDYQPAHYYLGLTLARLGEKAAADRELATATQLAEAQQATPHPGVEAPR